MHHRTTAPNQTAAGSRGRIDVETHELAPPNKKRGAIGKFGLFGADLGDTCAHLRLVQLGWTVGKLNDDTPCTKVRVVKPTGFVIDPAATAVHRITQELAEAEVEENNVLEGYEKFMKHRNEGEEKNAQED